jgi:hypothetical protein
MLLPGSCWGKNRLSQKCISHGSTQIKCHRFSQMKTNPTRNALEDRRGNCILLSRQACLMKSLSVRFPSAYGSATLPKSLRQDIDNVLLEELEK